MSEPWAVVFFAVRCTSSGRGLARPRALAARLGSVSPAAGPSRSDPCRGSVCRVVPRMRKRRTGEEEEEEEEEEKEEKEEEEDDEEGGG